MANMVEDSVPQLQNPPPTVQILPLQITELRIAILRNVPNLQTLRNLVLSCSTFSTVYYSHQRQILLHLAREAFDVDRVNMAIPLLACRAQHVQVLASNHLEMVTALLKANLEHNALTKHASLQISIAECKQMLLLKDVASQICNDLVLQMSLQHPLGEKNMMRQKPLSATERGRITTAVYRWELWAGLFSQRTRNLIQEQSPAARIDVDAQITVYLARYTIWEQEQLGCLYDYVRRRYRRLFGESAKWFDENKEPGHCDPADEDLNPWYMLYEHKGSSDFNADQIIGRGPRLLTALLSKDDKKWRCDTIMTCIYNFDTCFREVISPEEVTIPAATDLDIGAKEDDQPYGYRWALATPRDYDSPKLSKAEEFLWHWGYAFWDENRLRDWGFEIDGPFFYIEMHPTFISEKEGIRDRASGQLLQKSRIGERI